MRRHITFSNVIACLALFIALGGISWAAATAPKNSVASKSIKNKAVTNAKIGNNAVTSTKIKTGQVFSGDVRDNSLTGVDINEGSLGTVPSASTATNAATADTAADQISVFRSVTTSSSNADANIARNQATEVLLASHGAVSLYGKCFFESDFSQVFAVIYARTTVNGATLLGGGVTDDLFGGPSLNAGTQEVDREVIYVGETPNSTTYGESGSASLIGPDGLGMNFSAFSVAKSGIPADAPGYLQGSAACAFQVSGSKTG